MLKNLVPLLALVAGVPVAAYGLADGNWLLALGGLALVLVFVYFATQWLAKANKQDVVIRPAGEPAWSMKDQPVQGAAPDDRKS